MTADSQGSSIEPIPIPQPHLSAVTSRLLTRGIDLVKATNKLLTIHRIIAFEDSVFVLSRDWDAHKSVQTSSWNTTDAWKNYRRLVLFEFHRTGAFIRKITMPLLELSTEGYSEVRGRRPGELTIRSTFIHFSEDLEVRKHDWSQSTRINVRLDYLFTRHGERRAAWSNGKWADRSRHSNEPRIPTSWWLTPEWASATKLIGVEEQYDSPQRYQYIAGARFKTRSFDKPSGNFIVSQKVDEWEREASPAEHNLELESISFATHDFYPTIFPTVRGWYRKWLSLSLCKTRSDPRALWFFEEYSAVNEQLNTVLWKLDMSTGTPRVIKYSLPHPYDLINEGSIDFHDKEGKVWIPSSVDYDILRQAYLEEAECEFLSPQWDGQYHSLYSWGDDLIVTFGMNAWDGNDAHLLCTVDQGEIRPIKLIDIGFYEVYLLVKTKKLVPHGREVSSSGTGDLSWHYANASFANGYLYSVATARWRDIQLRNDIVVVKNVHTGYVSWFRPEVPESYLESVTVPDWDPYWDRLKSG